LLFAGEPARAALEIVSPQAVMDRYVVDRAGKLYLEVGGAVWELVTDPHDPIISQLGDGSFHPMRQTLVRDAIQGLAAPAAGLDGTVLILPYPRRANLKSSCERGVILLSPGIREVAPEHVHATTIHEIGHLVQTTRAREGSAAWEEYLDRRGLRDARFSPTAMHRDRPREIFAEDFRFLFGTPLATSSGTIENQDLSLPSAVPGLQGWFEQLLRAPRTEAVPEDARDARVFPNPFRPVGQATISFASQEPARAASSPEPAILVDVAGRRVRALARNAPLSEGEATFRWDGRDEAGRLVPSGMYFVRYPHASVVARVHFLR
jgi:hypothetical protein